MQFTDDARALLESLEGCKLTAYTDEAGVWTIGYGHTGPDVQPGLVWTPSQAELALARDLGSFISGVERLVQPAPLNDNQFSALVIFTYNIGLAAFAASSALRYIRQRSLSYVPSAMLLWDKIHEPRTGHLVVSEILLARRHEEIELWSKP